MSLKKDMLVFVFMLLMEACCEQGSIFGVINRIHINDKQWGTDHFQDTRSTERFVSHKCVLIFLHVPRHGPAARTGSCCCPAVERKIFYVAAAATSSRS